MERPVKTKVGLILWNAQVRYQLCRDGVIDQLRQEGFAEPQVTIVVEHADANKIVAAELVERFSAAHISVFVPIGTSAAVAVAAQIKLIPVVFAFVFDPVRSKIAQDWKSSGNNTTGSSSKTPARVLLSSLKQLAPVKRLAVLYTPGERNTEAQANDLEALNDPQVQVTAVPLSSRADVAPALRRLEGTADAILLTGSNVIADTAVQIVFLANKAKIITATQSEDMENKVMLGVTANPDTVGRLAGKKVAMVLRGAKPDSIEIEALQTADLVLNLRIAKAIGLEVPAALKKAATRLIE